MKDRIMIPDMSNLIAIPEMKTATKAQNRPNPVFDAKHPKVNDDKDHFPLGDADQARNALARANQYSAAPKWWNGTLQELKNAVARKVKSEFPSIEVSKESTASSSVEIKQAQSFDIDMDDFIERVSTMISDAEMKMKISYKDIANGVLDAIEEDPYYSTMSDDVREEVEMAAYRALKNVSALPKGNPGSGTVSYDDYVMSSTFRQLLKKALESLGSDQE